LLVYKDDSAAGTKAKISLQRFFETLWVRFNAKTLGEIETILRAIIMNDRKNRTLYLDQEQYLMTVLNRCGITPEKHKSEKISTANYESLYPAHGENKRININKEFVANSTL
jgi:hypothetical protein